MSNNMKAVKMKDLNKMNRRRFVKTLTALGASPLAVNYLSRGSVGQVVDDPEKEVPIVEFLKHTNPDYRTTSNPNGPPEREPVFDTISRERWIRVETAHKAAHAVEQKLEAELDSTAAKVGVTSLSSDGLEKAVKVCIPTYNTSQNDVVKLDSQNGRVKNISEGDLEEVLPSSVSGTVSYSDKEATINNIPIVIEESTRELTAVFDSKYRPVPGGCQIQLDNSNCTSCAAAYNNNANQKQMITAGHCLAPRGSQGDRVHQPVYGNYIGRTYARRFNARYDSNGRLKNVLFDAGVIDNSGAGGFTKDIAAGGTNNYREAISGIVPWETVKQREGDQSWKVRKQGRTTGVTTGYITDVFGTDKEFVNTSNVSGGTPVDPIIETMEEPLAL